MLDESHDTTWSDARGQMLLDPAVINLNSGSWGPLSRPVYERVTELRRRLAEEPMDYFVRLAPPLLWQARERVAAFLNTDPKRLIFAANVSSAINIVASGLRLAAPGEILLTDHEYGATHWCLERAAQRQGLTLRTFKLPLLARSPQEIVDAACAATSQATRLFFFSHILSPTGLVLPAQALCAEARKRGILTLVDGAHAVAMRHLDMKQIDADFYAGNSHKWLLAPMGSGFLHFGRDALERIQPLQVSWGYQYDPRLAEERDAWGCTHRLRAMEFEGFRDISPWIATATAIDFQEGIGWERLRGRIADLASYVRARLTGLGGLTLMTPAGPELSGALSAFRLPTGVDGRGLQKKLWEQKRIEIALVERPEKQMVRVSTHWYNTHEEIDQLEAALRELLV